MKNFIEVTYHTDDVKYCLNINHIVWLIAIGDKTSIKLYDGTRLNVKEPYEELVALIEAVTV